MIESGERNASVPVAKNIAKVLNFDWTLFLKINVTFCVIANMISYVSILFS